MFKVLMEQVPLVKSYGDLWQLPVVLSNYCIFTPGFTINNVWSLALLAAVVLTVIGLFNCKIHWFCIRALLVKGFVGFISFLLFVLYVTQYFCGRLYNLLDCLLSSGALGLWRWLITLYLVIISYRK